MKIGTVSHLPSPNAVLQVIVDVGGFLGTGVKPEALAASALNFVRADDGAVYAKTTWTKDLVRALPEHHH